MNLPKATRKGTDIASATTITPASTHDRFDVTGTTTITTINTDGRGTGARFWLRFSGAVQITHDGTKLKLTGAANFTSAAGDAVLFEVIGTNQVQELVRRSALAAADLPTGIDATKLADGSVTNTELQYIGGLTSDAQTQLAAKVAKSAVPVTLSYAIGDQTNEITTGTKLTFRMPHAMTLTEVRFGLQTPSTAGAPEFDVQEGGVSVFSTTVTVDQDEKTSVTAATPAVISDGALADDAEITVSIETAGTGAIGPVMTLIGTRSV